jgi:hypothetical protein
MAIRLTESRLKQIIREETARLARPLRESYSYSNKLSLIRDAIDLLREAQVVEQQSAMGVDPDLDNLVEELEGYAESVAALAADEDAPVSYPTSIPARRAMRH